MKQKQLYVIFSFLLLQCFLFYSSWAKSDARVSDLSKLRNILTKKITDALDQNVADAFMVKLSGCTGTLISKDWILTAAHCYSNLREDSDSRKNEFGDIEVNVKGEMNQYTIVEKPKASRIKKKHLWTNPIQYVKHDPGNPSAMDQTDSSVWRKVEKIIIHKKFESEVYSWKGYDLALLKMEPNLANEDQTGPEGIVAPICLPSVDFPDFEPKSTFMSGYGRRTVPHCLTDIEGPEKFEVCGRPIGCSKEHRTQVCGLKFVYKGQFHNECLKTETPSAHDPECKKFREKVSEVEEKIVYIVEGKDKYVTTCYPKKPSENSKGWCTTRPPGVDENTEPYYDEGWGFCSEDRSQRECNTHITENINSTAMPVSILNENYCNDKLEDNLKVEQPETERNEYEHMRSENGVICLGRNITDRIPVSVYDKSNNYAKLKSIDSMTWQLLREKAGVKEHRVNGGPSCFGDSGGPLFRLVQDDRTGRAVPVLTGVFSFMLWGTCQGRAEPSYYGRLIHSLPWIKQYVSTNDICWYSKHVTS